jgi:guanosine-3',5'-bis(diphosphate) 3'-pyrophosphohydrolase
MGFERLKEVAQTYLPAEKLGLVAKAYEFAAKAHEGQMRKSGDPYIEHPLETALTLAKLQLDSTTLAAALLHDVIENCGIPSEKIEAEFGKEVAKLVDGVTRLAKLSWSADGVGGETQAKNLRRMLVAMAEDLRVVFIKLADRLHNMATLWALPAEKQKFFARETLDIYTPLAHRLGIWELKWQLEDYAFRYLQPEKYEQIVKLLAARREQREEFIDGVINILRERFDRAGLKAEISGRPKHIYSIYQKMEKYANLGKQFDDIHDLLAIRVLVEDEDDCYPALGIVHNLWRPIPGEFDDYIGNPKANGYQSLHTAVMCQGTTPLEVQIRTKEMHHISEYGMAAHWSYKEGKREDMKYEERISWLRQLVDWHREFSGAEEFLESVKTDIFIDQVFVYTPRGEIKDLPKGATPLDFAYRVHTELGHMCVGAKVNGKLVPLNYQLKNGDIVEILTSKTAKGPSRDWLNQNLGYVRTTHAREKIRQWFRKQQRAENIERGRELLEKEVRRMGLTAGLKEELAKQFKYDNLDDFLAAIGYGDVSTQAIGMKLAVEQEQPKTHVEPTPTRKLTSAVNVLGVSEMLTNLAQCCNPVPGDDIVGYITRSRGITVHRAGCPNIIQEDEKERLIPVEWEQADNLYPVNIQVESWDRVGLVRDITNVIANDKINIKSVNSAYHDDSTATIFLTLETKDLLQLSQILGKIEGVQGVIGVTRIGNESRIKPGP